MQIVKARNKRGAETARIRSGRVSGPAPDDIGEEGYRFHFKLGRNKIPMIRYRMPPRIYLQRTIAWIEGRIVRAIEDRENGELKKLKNNLRWKRRNLRRLLRE